MKKILTGLIFSAFATVASANEIYITQSGDSLDLDITQTGSSNNFGDSTTDVVLNGDNMTFSITQTGDTNDISAVIYGDTYTGTWSFTGNTNVVELLCNSSQASNCTTVTLDVDVVGSNNTFYFDIGETEDASGADIMFDVDADGNIVDMEVDGTNATIDVVINKNGSLASTTVSDALTTYTTSQGSGSIMIIDVNGDGLTGHTIDLVSNGGANVFEITQTGILEDQTISADFNGDLQNVVITQSD